MHIVSWGAGDCSHYTSVVVC